METPDQARNKFAGLRSGWQQPRDTNTQWQRTQAAHAQAVQALATGIGNSPADWDPDHLAAIRDAAIALAAAAMDALNR